MFSKQASALMTSLLQAGFSAPQAAALQNLLGQSQQALLHSGPVQFDYTRQDMRLIGPEEATQKYPGCVLPVPKNFPDDPARPESYPVRPRGPGQPPHQETPDTRLGHEKENRPGGHMPPEHLRIEPQAPVGPGEESQFPNQPWGPNAYNNRYFGGEYIRIDDATRQISLENNDARRHAVFPGMLNRRGMVNSVEFVDKPGGNVPEFIRIAINEQSEKTIFSVETTALQRVQYISGIDMSEVGKVKFLRQEAWVFGPSDLDEFVTANCCCSDCDCTELSPTQPNLAFTSPDCPELFCPDPSPEVCDCPSIQGTIGFNGSAPYGAGCILTWEDDVAGCYEVDELGIQRSAHLYVTATCLGAGAWEIGVVLYKAFDSELQQTFTGNGSTQMCVVDGKLTGTGLGIILTNGAGDTCTITLTFNP